MAGVPWTVLYQNMLPAGVNPNSALNMYGKGALGTQWYRIQADAKANLDDLMATLNKRLLIKAEKKIAAEKAAVSKVQRRFKDSPAAQKVLRQEKKKLRKDLRKVKKVGTALINKQEAESKQQANWARHMFGLGARPDYRYLQPPAMKGPLIDIYGTYHHKKNQGLNGYYSLGNVEIVTPCNRPIAPFFSAYMQPGPPYFGMMQPPSYQYDGITPAGHDGLYTQPFFWSYSDYYKQWRHKVKPIK